MTITSPRSSAFQDRNEMDTSWRNT